MREGVLVALRRLNRRFYAEHEGEFAAHRQAPWPGWSGLLPYLPQRRPLAVLDAGAGHGRFAAWLVDQGVDVRYLGLDQSEPLLERARRRLAGDPRCTFRAHDLAEALPPGGPFDLVALLAVLHHVPAEMERAALLSRLAGALAPGGLLAISVWQMDPAERARRQVPWSEAGLAEAELEEGDVLLRFAGRGLRYCHFAGDVELTRLTRGLGLTCAADYRADGAGGGSNRYLCLRAPATCAPPPPRPEAVTQGQ